MHDSRNNTANIHSLIGFSEMYDYEGRVWKTQNNKIIKQPRIKTILWDFFDKKYIYWLIMTTTTTYKVIVNCNQFDWIKN